jgi:hypothetical protein
MVNESATFPGVPTGLWLATAVVAIGLITMGHLWRGMNIGFQTGEVHLAYWIACCGAMRAAAVLFRWPGKVS